MDCEDYETEWFEGDRDRRRQTQGDVVPTKADVLGQTTTKSTLSIPSVFTLPTHIKSLYQKCENAGDKLGEPADRGKTTKGSLTVRPRKES